MSENCSGVDDCGNDVTSALSINEKGRNKRKFISDMPSDIPVQVSTPSLTEFPRYETMDEKSQNALNELGSLMGISEDSNEEQDMEEFQQYDWDDPLVFQLEALFSNALFSTFCLAVTKIVQRGYTEKVAEWAVLHGSLFHCGTDAVSNVVDSALAFIKRQKEFNIPNPPLFEGLLNLVDYTLVEMVYVLRDIRPSMTVFEAMWSLLINDLNLLAVCVAEGGTVDGSTKDSNDSGSSKQIMTNDEGSRSKAPAALSCDPSTNKHCPCELDKQCPCELGIKNSLICRAANGKLGAIVKEHIQAASHAIVADEKSRSRGKGLSVNSTRDMLRQKAVPFEKGYKSCLSKGSFKAKVAAWGSLVRDKSLRSQSGSSSAAMKGALTKLATLAGTSSKDPSTNSPSLSQDPAVNSKTNASVSDAPGDSKGDDNISDPPEAIDYYASIPFDETLQKHIPQDYKDTAILMLVPHKEDIEKELQELTDWANEKVMQAARRLGKDKAELKMLKKEKEEMDKFKKEKQTLDDSTMKRLSEMECALNNATCQLEVANRNIRRLEEENKTLKSNLETAKELGLKAASNLQLVLQSEQETLKKFQSWDAEKRSFEQILTNLRRKIAVFNNQLEKAKERQDQFTALFNQEQKEKLKSQTQIDSLRSKLEEETALVEVEADKIKQTAEKEMQKYEDNIKNLENLIAGLKLESNGWKIAALNMGYVSYFPGSQLPRVSRRLPVFQGNFGEKAGVKRERECVMCMTEEILVVFIPCSHQVICRECNELLEKEGMNDCPSCRSQIQGRVCVRYRG